MTPARSAILRPSIAARAAASWLKCHPSIARGGHRHRRLRHLRRHASRHPDRDFCRNLGGQRSFCAVLKPRQSQLAAEALGRRHLRQPHRCSNVLLQYVSPRHEKHFRGFGHICAYHSLPTQPSRTSLHQLPYISPTQASELWRPFQRTRPDAGITIVGGHEWAIRISASSQHRLAGLRRRGEWRQAPGSRRAREPRLNISLSTGRSLKSLWTMLSQRPGGACSRILDEAMSL